MKYITAAVLAVCVCAAGAHALSWDSIIYGPARSIKAFFAPVTEPASSPARLMSADLPLNLPPETAKHYLDADKPVLLDVRTPEEYAAGHIAAAVSVDYYAADFKDRLDRMDKTAAYVIYCRSGKRSAASLKIMQELGFSDVHDIAGGFNAWTGAGYPAVK